MTVVDHNNQAVESTGSASSLAEVQNERVGHDSSQSEIINAAKILAKLLLSRTGNGPVNTHSSATEQLEKSSSTTPTSNVGSASSGEVLTIQQKSAQIFNNTLAAMNTFADNASTFLDNAPAKVGMLKGIRAAVDEEGLALNRITKKNINGRRGSNVARNIGELHSDGTSAEKNEAFTKNVADSLQRSARFVGVNLAGKKDMFMNALKRLGAGHEGDFLTLGVKACASSHEIGVAISTAQIKENGGKVRESTQFGFVLLIGNVGFMHTDQNGHPSEPQFLEVEVAFDKSILTDEVLTEADGDPKKLRDALKPLAREKIIDLFTSLQEQQETITLKEVYDKIQSQDSYVIKGKKPGVSSRPLNYEYLDQVTSNCAVKNLDAASLAAQFAVNATKYPSNSGAGRGEKRKIDWPGGSLAVLGQMAKNAEKSFDKLFKNDPNAFQETKKQFMAGLNAVVQKERQNEKLNNYLNGKGEAPQGMSLGDIKMTTIHKFFSGGAELTQDVKERFEKLFTDKKELKDGKDLNGLYNAAGSAETMDQLQVLYKALTAASSYEFNRDTGESSYINPLTSDEMKALISRYPGAIETITDQVAHQYQALGRKDFDRAEAMLHLNKQTDETALESAAKQMITGVKYMLESATMSSQPEGLYRATYSAAIKGLTALSEQKNSNAEVDGVKDELKRISLQATKQYFNLTGDAIRLKQAAIVAQDKGALQTALLAEISLNQNIISADDEGMLEKLEAFMELQGLYDDAKSNELFVTSKYADSDFSLKGDDLVSIQNALNVTSNKYSIISEFMKGFNSEARVKEFYEAVGDLTPGDASEFFSMLTRASEGILADKFPLVTTTITKDKTTKVKTKRMFLNNDVLNDNKLIDNIRLILINLELANKEEFKKHIDKVLERSNDAVKGKFNQDIVAGLVGLSNRAEKPTLSKDELMEVTSALQVGKSIMKLLERHAEVKDKQGTVITTAGISPNLIKSIKKAFKRAEENLRNL